MKRNAPPREPLLMDMLASLAMFVVGATVVALVLTERLPALAYLLTHLGCSALSILQAISSGSPPRRQALLLAVFATFLGPVGTAGVFLSTVLEFSFRPHASPFEEWFETIFPPEDEDGRQAFLDLLGTSEDPLQTSKRLNSFRDTITSGSIENKQALLGLIARRFSPAFAPALRQALQDPVPAIRVQAAAATAAIESRFADTTFKLTEQTKKPGAKLEDHTALALHLISFAESGISEEQRAAEAITTAQNHLEVVLKQRPMDLTALVASSKLLLKVNNPREARIRLQRAITMAGNTATLTALHLECLLQLGSYQEIKSLARNWKIQPGNPGRDEERLAAAVRFWTMDHSDAA